MCSAGETLPSPRRFSALLNCACFAWSPFALPHPPILPMPMCVAAASATTSARMRLSDLVGCNNATEAMALFFPSLAVGLVAVATSTIRHPRVSLFGCPSARCRGVGIISPSQPEILNTHGHPLHVSAELSTPSSCLQVRWSERCNPPGAFGSCAQVRTPSAFPSCISQPWCVPAPATDVECVIQWVQHRAKWEGV